MDPPPALPVGREMYQLKMNMKYEKHYTISNTFLGREMYQLKMNTRYEKTQHY